MSANATLDQLEARLASALANLDRLEAAMKDIVRQRDELREELESLVNGLGATAGQVECEYGLPMRCRWNSARNLLTDTKGTP